MSIFLAMFPPNATEVHIRWDGHKTLETAQFELAHIRKTMIGENRIPMDCQVYEADTPPFGLPIHTVDDVDFNFYREKTPEENQRAIDAFERSMAVLKAKAEEEERNETAAVKNA
jgi:hypothetical protein